MDRHAYCQMLINRLLDEDKELSAEEKREMQAHLDECAECRAMQKAYAALSGFVGGELEEPPGELRENIMAQIRREEIRRRNRRAFGWTGFAAAAAVFALIIGFAPRMLARGDMNSTALTTQMVGGAVYEERADAGANAAGKEIGETYVTMDSAAAAAAAAAPAAEDPYLNWNEETADREPAEAESDGAPPAAAEEEKLSMDALLMRLAGLEAKALPENAQLSPLFLIDTDRGVIEICRYNNSLYYTDPYTGILCEAACSESELLRFLEG